MTPIAEPRPNSRTATMLLVASDAMPSAVVPLAPSSGAARCVTVRLERLLGRPVPPRLAIVLNDVHVVGDRQHDHERHDHAAQDVVVEPEQVVEAERPDDADEHGPGVSSVRRHDRNIA